MYQYEVAMANSKAAQVASKGPMICNQVLAVFFHLPPIIHPPSLSQYLTYTYTNRTFQLRSRPSRSRGPYIIQNSNRKIALLQGGVVSYPNIIPYTKSKRNINITHKHVTMALFSARTVITSLSLLHITLAFFFLTNPSMIEDQGLVYVIGESMGMVRPPFLRFHRSFYLSTLPVLHN